MEAKELILQEIRNFIRNHEQSGTVKTRWGEPLVGIADAKDPYILSLKDVVSPTHAMPTDVMDDAKRVIAYFVPFTPDMASTNTVDSTYASPEWAQAYEETNAMLKAINNHLIQWMAANGHGAGVSVETATYDKTRLISNWSHRHFAKAAGLGTFGHNNMLITSVGCCGRYSSLVTDWELPIDAKPEKENCYRKAGGNCDVCIRHCPVDALTPEGYDRQKCNVHILENAKIHQGYGSSYDYASGTHVCGKCVVGLPCSFIGM